MSKKSPIFHPPSDRRVAVVQRNNQVKPKKGFRSWEPEEGLPSELFGSTPASTTFFWPTISSRVPLIALTLRLIALNLTILGKVVKTCSPTACLPWSSE